MKKIIPFIAVLLCIVCTSCGSSRYTASGINLHQIQEFAFLKPCAYMVLYETDGGYYNQNNTDIATQVITTVINSERFPFSEVMEADYQGADKDALEWAKGLRDIKTSQVERLRVPKSILSRLEGSKDRYGLFIYSYGYNMTQEAYDRERLSKAASKVIDTAAEKITGVGGLTNPSRIYTPSDPYGNEMVCLVIDKQEQRVIYYAKQTPTFASHPKDNADVSKLLHKLLKDFIR